MVTTLLSSTKWYPVLFNSPLNATRSVAIWLTLALVIAAVVCAVLLKGEKRKKFLKIAVIAAIVYAAALGVTLLALTFAEDGIVTLLFAPFLTLIIVIAASAVTLFFKRNKIVYAVTGCAVGGALIAAFVCMGVQFSTGVSGEMNGVSAEDVNQIGLYVCAVLLLAAVVGAAFLFDRKNKSGFDSKSIAYASVCIAMSFALSYLRIVKMPQGGSITIASLLPLMLYAFMFGTKKGVFAGFIFGLLQALQDPYILHPAQFVLDYPAAFACIGLAGIFANFKKLEKLPQIQFLLGGVVAGLGRFIMHFLSGVFAFGAYAPAGQPVWVYSLGYQAGYVLPDIAIAIAAGVLALCSPRIAKLVKKVNYVKPVASEPVLAESAVSESAVTQSQATESADTSNVNDKD